jgi:hypothetical protein
MKKFILLVFASCFALTSAQSGQYVLGENFVVSKPTTISAIGAYDGGTGFTSSETVGVFSDLTGTLVGSEVVFGPGKAGNQVGSILYENVANFVLSPGDYSIIAISTGGLLPSGEGGLSGGNSYQDLGDDVNVPTGARFNFGTGFNISLAEGNGLGSRSRPLVLIDPATVGAVPVGAVPDGGMTAMLLGASLAGLGWVRRKF